MIDFVGRISGKWTFQNDYGQIKNPSNADFGFIKIIIQKFLNRRKTIDRVFHVEKVRLFKLIWKLFEISINEMKGENKGVKRRISLSDSFRFPPLGAAGP